MPDPESSKPDDWDEDEPRMIDDPDASMPAGWLEDEEKRIADPSAKMPSDWDEDEDGEWEAPTIDNPACNVGCGKWVPPKISNPKYKGKWSAPLIDNPNYIGVWKPRQIENPDYFVDEEPGMLPQIDSVGIDIWTMQGSILLDNFAIATNEQSAKEFTMQTFDVRKIIEDKQNPSSSSGTLTMIVDTLRQNPIPAALTIILLVAGALFLACRGESLPPAPPAAAASKQKEKSDKPASSSKDGAKDDSADSATAKEEKPKADTAGGVGLDEKEE
jgi:calnexin